MKKKVLVRQQDETDCGAACIATVARYYGKRVSISRIRYYAGTDVMGTSGVGIVKGAEALGFKCRGMLSEKKKLPEGIQMPWVAHVRKRGLDHYVVVYGCKRGKVIVADPDEGLLKIGFDSFREIWTGVFFLITPDEGFVRTKETKGLVGRFLYLLKPFKKTLLECFAGGLLLSLLGVAGAFYFRFLIDDVLYSGLENTLWVCSIAYLGVILFQCVLEFCRNQLMNYMGNKIDLVLIRDYFRHILRLPMDFFTSRKTGEILSRIGDTTTIRHTISSTSLGVVIDSCMLVVGGVFLMAFGTKLLMVAVVPVVLSAFLVWIFIGPFRKKIKEQAVAEAEKQSALVESVNGIGTIKALSSEKAAYERVEQRITDCTRRSIDLGTMGSWENLLQSIVSRGGTLAMYWIGSILIFKGQLSLGQLISFVTLSGYFLDPLGRLLTLQQRLQEAVIAGDRLGQIMDLLEEDEISGGENNSVKKIDCEKESISEKLKPDSLKGRISFRNVSFAYGTRGLALKNISFEVRPGEKVAFVGLSGSGKSTVTKLLMKFYKPSRGSILVDGVNIEDYDTGSYRSAIGYVPQEVLLFSGSIAENIMWGSPGHSSMEMIKAAAAARADEFIERLDDRYGTVVGERGATLSGGERQRISLARVFLRKPGVLILDEATSSLDSISEKGIMDTIDESGKGATMIIVAHRLSTIRQCDQILVFDKGKVVEKGSHLQLMNKRGKYYEMWRAQNEEIDCVA